MFSYRTLLKQTWDITWRNKYLWFFGLFASLVASGGSLEYQALTRNLNQGLIDGSYTSLGGVLYLGDLLSSLWAGLGILFAQDIWTIINATTLILVTLTLVVSCVWLAITSQVGLIDNVKRIINSKKKHSTISIRESLTLGNQHFWPVLGLNVLIKILVSAAFFVISLPILFMLLNDTTVLVIVYTILFVIFMPVAVSLSLMVKYAIAYKVLQKKSFIVALEKGWKLFTKNWLISLEIAIILFLISFLFGIATLVVIAVLLLPLFMVGIMFQLAWLTALMLFLGLVVVVLFGSFMTTFQTAAWTDLFLRLDGKNGLAKLERMFRKK